MKKILPLLLLGLASVTDAQTSTVSAKLDYVPPTKNTDGSAIVGSLTYNIYQGAKGAVKTKVSSTAGSTVTISNVAPGTCFEVSALNGTIEGPHTNEACLPFSPGSPSSLTVTVVITLTTP